MSSRCRRRTRALDVAIYDTYSFSWYGYNLDPEKTTLFQDVKTRQALFYALDRQTMVDNIQLGFGEVANGTQPTLSTPTRRTRSRPSTPTIPTKATAAARRGRLGRRDGDGIREKDGQKLSFEIMYGSGSATTDQVVAVHAGRLEGDRRRGDARTRSTSTRCSSRR